MRPTPDRRPITWIISAVLVAGLIGTASLPAAGQSSAQPAFIVEVNTDGSAQVAVRSTFDLTTDAEQAAFRSLETDEEAQSAAVARFLDRLRAVANDAENVTGREMRVSDASIEVRRTDDNETGIVALSATWDGLAARSDDRLRVTEPFASGFEPDRRFVLRPPDGYSVRAVTPSPAQRSDDMVVWAAGTDLTGFSVELEPAESTGGTDQPPADDEETRTDGQPGFGVLATVLALVVAVAGALARRVRA